MAGNTGGPVSETGPAMRLAAARVELEGGYVAFVVSDELLPADVRRSVAATVGGAAASSGGDAAGAGGDASEGSDGGSGRSSGTAEALVGAEKSGDVSESIGERRGQGAREPTRTLKDLLGDAAARSSAKRPRARPGIAAVRAAQSANLRKRPLWVIVQSDEPHAPHEASQTPVPAPDVRPTRGILRHRHSKPPQYSLSSRHVPGHQTPPYGRSSSDIIAGHVAGGALDQRVPPNWLAADGTVGLSSPGRKTGEEFDHEEFHFSDDPGSSPDVHSGVSSGESSGDEGLSGDEGSDGGDPLSTTAASGHGAMSDIDGVNAWGGRTDAALPMGGLDAAHARGRVGGDGVGGDGSDGLLVASPLPTIPVPTIPVVPDGRAVGGSGASAGVDGDPISAPISNPPPPDMMGDDDGSPATAEGGFATTPRTAAAAGATRRSRSRRD